MKTRALVLALLLPSALPAAPLQPEDFAWGASIQVTSNSGLQVLTLPYAVLAGMARDDRGDLRVFNAAGAVVPHGFAPAPEETAPRVHQTLPIFPLATLDESGRETLPDLEIERDQQGQVLRITQRPGPQTERKTLGYLIDNSKADLPLVEIELDWPRTESGHIARIAVEGSSDLEYWTPLAQATLADMQFGGEHLLRRTIALPSARQPYLRLRWLSGESLKLESVHGLFRNAPPERWDSHVLQLVREKDPGTWSFSLPGPLPFERLALEIERENVLYQGRLFSRRDNDADWRLRAPLLQYRIRVGDELLKSEPMPIDGAGDREWRIELDQPEFLDEPQAGVRLSWRPRRIMFLASGPAPFRLAWGNPAIAPASGMSGLGEVGAHLPEEEARLGDITPLGGEMKLKPPFRWQPVLLWGVLLAGVGLMGWMAIRLARQMREH